MMAELRKIIHVDMDAFFASVEQRDFPAYRGKPLAVGGSRERGVVAAASYEARKFGVHSAMPAKIAFRKCPDIIFVKPRFEVYREVSSQIRAIFHAYTDLVEPLSLDEAYLDVTDNKIGHWSAVFIARQIKADILAKTGLTASAGVSFNKFLAKIASDLNKPNGLSVILPEEAERFLEKLPIGKFHGIGKVTAEKMQRLGIYAGADLKAQTKAHLLAHFGKAGSHYYHMVRAEDQRPVRPDRVRKSVGAERTFSADLTSLADMDAELLLISRKVAERMEAGETMGRTITLKIKYHDFTIQTRSRTASTWLHTARELYVAATELLRQPEPDKAVRLLGISVASLDLPANTGATQLKIPFPKRIP